MRIRSDDYGDCEKLQFSVSSNNSSPSGESNVMMSLNKDGNVGIGSTNPKGKLGISNSSSVTSYTDYTNHSIILRNPINSSSHNSGIVWTMENPSQYGHQGSVGIMGDGGANGLVIMGI